jgi:iodotyrosine deiodinase
MSNTKVIDGYEFVRYTTPEITEQTMVEKSTAYFEFMDRRRTVRDFSSKPFPRSVIENILRTASTAPSGAHKQPWTFCVVTDPTIKKQILSEAEREEFDNYHGRMSDEWMRDLKPLQTDWKKEFLETAPYLIVVFKKIYELEANGHKHNNYYVLESVGIACGFLLAAIHNAGLVALTHTPSPMNFLSRVLRRPENEKPFLVIPVGYPAQECFVPKLQRKPLDQVSVFY